MSKSTYAAGLLTFPYGRPAVYAAVQQGAPRSHFCSGIAMSSPVSARALLPLDGATQITTASEIAAKKLSVREAEKLVAKAQGSARQTPLLRVKTDKSRDVLRLEEELADALGATVEVRVKKRTKKGGQSGELAIHFDSLDALSGILDKLRGEA